MWRRSSSNAWLYIVIVNLVAFVPRVLLGGYFLVLFGLNPILAIYGGFAWQFITYMFVHGDLLHLLFNMYALFLFGPAVERYMGTKNFVAYYFACGIGSAFFHILLTGMQNLTLIGASGAIFGVLVAYAMFFPRALIMIFPIPIPLPARYAVVLIGFLSFLLGITAASSPIAHFGHLGGIITGFLIIKLFRPGPKPYYVVYDYRRGTWR